MSGGTAVGTARRSVLTGIELLDDARIGAGTRVLLRLDWNVPRHEGRVLDPGRIQATFPVLDRLVGCGAQVTVATHLGYPGGRPAEGLATAVLAPYVARYSPALRLLENLRFFAGEQANDPGFAAELTRDQDVFVNDAFSCMHRPHASVVGVPALLPGLLGPLARRELAALDRWWHAPREARGLIVGGNKVIDKLPLLEALAPHAAVVAVAGRTALPFLVASDRATGEVGVEPWELAAAQRLLAVRDDVLVPSELVALGSGRPVRRLALHSGEQYVDVGPAAAGEFAEALRPCASVLWSGPLGRYEEPPFARGTALFLRSLGPARRTVIAGGGDTCAAARRLGTAGELAHLSTGGGAMLAYLATGDLVGLAALRDAQPVRTSRE